MNRLVFIVVSFMLAFILNAAPAQANDDYECHSVGLGQCVNNGSFAHGFVEGCYVPNNVIITFAYYGHVNGQFPEVHYMQHFYYNDPPFWTVAYFDRDDSMSGWRVYWSMGGPHQDYPGQNHLLYEINAGCEAHDGPKQRIGIPGGEIF